VKPLVISSEAEAELDEAMTWYQGRREGLGLELQDEVSRALGWIRERPSRGWKYDDFGYRVHRVNRFPYLVYYLETDQSIWVSAIAHVHREPDYWRGRTPD
jgi:toxin ParE1/3/4